MKIMGIDPGKSGAIAVREDGHRSVVPMPLVRSAKGKDEYDLAALYNLFEVNHGDTAFAHVFIERLWAMPASMGGSAANYSRGYALGILEGMCVALKVPYTLVSPARWQKAMLLGVAGDDTKQRAIIQAQRFFPLVDLRRTERSRKADHGFADALLICEFGWSLL